MTDRIHALTVFLQEPMRVDDAEELIKAIRQFRGVSDVTVHVADPDIYWARNSAKHELIAKLFKLLDE